jgi:putative membrane protein
MMWDAGWTTGMWGGWFGMAMMGFFSLLILVGVVLIVVWIVRSFGHGESTPQGPASSEPGDTAVAIARERFARGEITREELDSILQTLGR